MIDYSQIFPSLDSDSKLWVFVADHPMSTQDKAALTAEIASFMHSWSSHGRKVIADFQIVDRQILLLSAMVEQGEISGCGIDKSLHVLEQFAAQNNFSWLGHLSIIYRDTSGTLQIVSRSDFRVMARSGAVTAATTVFDTSISLLSELRNGDFERSAGTSWHGRVFQLETSVHA
ncbi:MAG: hypothetical protein O3B41_02205 [Bacteroidetes bacterium]|nr:hypothetical protein [Bacteroidota bacterium]